MKGWQHPYFDELTLSGPTISLLRVRRAKHQHGKHKKSAHALIAFSVEAAPGASKQLVTALFNPETKEFSGPGAQYISESHRAPIAAALAAMPEEPANHRKKNHLAGAIPAKPEQATTTSSPSKTTSLIGGWTALYKGTPKETTRRRKHRRGAPSSYDVLLSGPEMYLGNLRIKSNQDSIFFDLNLPKSFLPGISYAVTNDKLSGDGVAALPTETQANIRSLLAELAGEIVKRQPPFYLLEGGYIAQGSGSGDSIGLEITDPRGEDYLTIFSVFYLNQILFARMGRTLDHPAWAHATDQESESPYDWDLKFNTTTRTLVTAYEGKNLDETGRKVVAEALAKFTGDQTQAEHIARSLATYDKTNGALVFDGTKFTVEERLNAQQRRVFLLKERALEVGYITGDVFAASSTSAATEAPGRS